MADFEVRQSKQLENGEIRVVTFIGRMTICSAQEIRGALLEAIARANEICLDLENVTEIDVAGMQLVCAAHRTAVNSQKSFSVNREIGGVIASFAADAGFLHHVGCMDGECCIWSGGGE